MAENRDIITKGIYKHAQTGGLVSVKQYIFCNKNNKRCLMLRFSNDTEVTINGMAFTVTELDANGKVIKHSSVHYSGKILPGQMFSSDDAVIVDSKCCDFKVVVDKVFSGNYEYTAVGGKVLIRYTGRVDTTKPRSVSYEEYEKLSRKRPVLSGVFKLIAIVLLLAIIVANFLFVFLGDSSGDESETAENAPRLTEYAQIEQTIDFTRSGYVEIR